MPLAIELLGVFSCDIIDVLSPYVPDVFALPFLSTVMCVRSVRLSWK